MRGQVRILPQVSSNGPWTLLSTMSSGWFRAVRSPVGAARRAVAIVPKRSLCEIGSRDATPSSKRTLSERRGVSNRIRASTASGGTALILREHGVVSFQLEAEGPSATMIIQNAKRGGQLRGGVR